MDGVRISSSLPLPLNTHDRASTAIQMTKKTKKERRRRIPHKNAAEKNDVELYLELYDDASTACADVRQALSGSEQNQKREPEPEPEPESEPAAPMSRSGQTTTPRLYVASQGGPEATQLGNNHDYGPATIEWHQLRRTRTRT